jgi:hypothetical protein
MSDRDVIDIYMDNFFRSYYGERAVKSLERLCEVLGYGNGVMRGRALEEMLTDNPGAIEALAEWIFEQVDQGPIEWQQKLEEHLKEEGLFEEVL